MTVMKIRNAANDAWLELAGMGYAPDDIGLEISGGDVRLKRVHMHYANRQNDSTWAGTRSSGWTTVPLNAELIDPNGWGTLNTSNYQVTVASGYYWCQFSYIVHQGAAYQEGRGYLYNATDGAPIAWGNPWRQYAYDPCFIWGFGYLNATGGSKTIYIRNYSNGAMAGYGFGWQGVSGLGVQTYVNYSNLILRRVY